jgi:hypothetical protein
MPNRTASCRICDRPIYPETTLCRKDYLATRRGRPVEVRFWEKVDRSGGPDVCWPWLGTRDAKGYGHFSLELRMEKAHRVALRLSGVEVPATLLVCHHCDNPPCCNPAHLFVGTVRDNALDMIAKGRHRRSRPAVDSDLAAGGPGGLRREQGRGSTAARGRRQSPARRAGYVARSTAHVAAWCLPGQGGGVGTHGPVAGADSPLGISRRPTRAIAAPA